MVTLTLLVVSIATLDSLNPSTVAPAAVLALGDDPLRRVGSFTAGVFLVSTAGGLALLFGLGRTVVARIAHPSAHARHLVELGIGVALLLAAALLWLVRERLRSRLGRDLEGRNRSALLLGAGIMAVELPTALPYFGAILLTLETAHGAVRQAILVIVFNVVLVAPLLGLAGLRVIAGGRGLRHVERLRVVLRRQGPVVFPIGLACIGAALTAVGAGGL